MQELFSLKDKVIVVTGATGVLGQSFIDAIADAGGVVGILGRNEERAIHRAEVIQQRGGKAIPLIADVMDRGQLERCRQKILDSYGRIDGLVNGAGGNRPGGILDPAADIFSFDINGMREVMDLNLWGTILPTQVFGQSIAAGGQGSIVNISSMTAQRVITKVLGYSMAKAAVENFTRWAAVEIANRYHDNIRMNAIAPGFFLTEQNRSLLTNTDGSFTNRGRQVTNQTPFKRFGAPDELKGALVWLLSDASKFITGAVVNVDGGFSVFGGA
ncbi:MAG: SDR family oxidoreductase [Flavisolibacter sp.]